jgi:hypothetical protein
MKKNMKDMSAVNTGYFVLRNTVGDNFLPEISSLEEHVRRVHPILYPVPDPIPAREPDPITVCEPDPIPAHEPDSMSHAQDVAPLIWVLLPAVIRFRKPGGGISYLGCPTGPC